DQLPAFLVGLDDDEALVVGGAVVARIERVLLGDARGRAADVERSHRQLRARLANRLRGDDAHSLTELDGTTGCEVPAIAALAPAAARRAREHRTDAHLLDAGFLHRRRLVLVDLLVDIDDRAGAERIDDLLERDAADDTVAKRLDDLARFDNGARLDAIEGAAVRLGDDHVLRDVDETTRQVARVCRLQCGIGQTLSSAVGRDEVLLHRQAFTEVARDRRFDDFARRLRHQTAHARQLANL